MTEVVDLVLLLLHTLQFLVQSDTFNSSLLIVFILGKGSKIFFLP